MLDLGTPMVTQGWTFTMGIANLFLIVAFIIIAFATILKMEPYGLKKALPKLIIVALLINFSLLFVKISVDITNFVFNTLINNLTVNGESLIITVMDALFAQGFTTVGWYIVWTAGMATAMLIPYVNVAVQAGLIFGLPLFLPILFRVLVYTIIMAGLAIIFLLYAFVFLARIFIIQILAIFSPLAFVCLIFPATQKYWSLWLKHLIGWLLAGVFFLFLLILAFGVVLPNLEDTADIISGVEQESLFISLLNVMVFGGLIYYLLLLAFMLVVIAVGKKLIPASAQAIISQGGNFLKGAALPFAKSYGQALTDVSTRAAIAGKERKERQLQLEKKAEAGKLTKDEQAEIKRNRGAWGKITSVGGGFLGGWGRATTRLSGSTLDLEADKIRQKTIKEAEEKFGDNHQAAMEVWGRWEKRGAQTGKLHFFQSATENSARLKYLDDKGGGKAINKIDEKNTNLIKSGMQSLAASGNPKDLESLWVHNRIREIVSLDKALHGQIKDKIMPDGLNDKVVWEMIEKDMKINGETASEALKKNRAVAQEKIMEKAMSIKAIKRLKDKDIEKMDVDTVNQQAEEIVRFNSKLIPKIYNEHGQEALNAITRSIEKLGWEEIVKTNPTLLKQMINNPYYKSIIPMEQFKGKDTFKGLGAKDEEILKQINNTVATIHENAKTFRQNEENWRKQHQTEHKKTASTPWNVTGGDSKINKNKT